MELFTIKALEGDKDCGGLLAYNYFSGEHITGFEEGRPLFVRKPDSNFNLANFMRVHLYTALGALKTGLDILMKEEDVKVDKMLGHGGLFKTEGVGQKIMAAAVNAPVSVNENSWEKVGAWGMAILAAICWIKQKMRRLIPIFQTKYLQEKKEQRLLQMKKMWKDLMNLSSSIRKVLQLNVQQ